jgi:hypothetical protein
MLRSSGRVDHQAASNAPPSLPPQRRWAKRAGDRPAAAAVPRHRAAVPHPGRDWDRGHRRQCRGGARGARIASRHAAAAAIARSHRPRPRARTAENGHGPPGWRGASRARAARRGRVAERIPASPMADRGGPSRPPARGLSGRAQPPQRGGRAGAGMSRESRDGLPVRESSRCRHPHARRAAAAESSWGRWRWV